MTGPGERVELSTERLVLRPISLEDFHEILAYSQDEEWGRYTPDPKPYTRRFGEQFVARKVLAPWETAPRFSIVLEDKVVGGVGLEIDAANKAGELAYSLARAHWGKGLVPEAARCVIAWGFRDLGLEKIFAQADFRNKRSLRVMEKLGMTREGVLRSHRKVRGERVDEVYYGILREEWEEQKPK
jgi:ribosomal-protein-alanine N-acetyltransferase